MTTNLSLPEQVFDAIRLNNTGHFFEAHEAFELTWRASESPQKEFFQALLWVSVLNYHLERGNLKGARKLVGRAYSRLTRYENPPKHIDMEGLIRALQRARDILNRSTTGKPALSIGIPIIIPIRG